MQQAGQAGAARRPTRQPASVPAPRRRTPPAGARPHDARARDGRSRDRDAR